MAAEVCTACGKVVSMGMGVLMQRYVKQPANGKGVKRQMFEKRHFRAENASKDDRF